MKPADAAVRGARRYEVLARAWSLCCAQEPHPVQVEAVLDGLEACARLEGWRLAVRLAARSGVDAWRQRAERMAASVVAASGDHRDSAAQWIDGVLSSASAT